MTSPDLPTGLLESLVAIADHGSLSAAARHRGLTQPSLSRQVADLEQRLGVRLVERDTAGARLTPAGEALVEGSREVLAQLAALPDRVRSRDGEVAGKVRIGTVDSVGIYLLPPILARLIQDHPRLDLTVRCQTSPELIASLLTGELDIAITTMDHPKLASEPLLRNRLVLIHPSGLAPRQLPRRLADLAKVRIVTFPKDLTVRKLLDQACLKSGVSLTPVMELANIEAIKAMVRAGLGYGIVPEGCVRGFELEERTLEGLDAARTIRLMTTTARQTLAADAVLTALRSLRKSP